MTKSCLMSFDQGACSSLLRGTKSSLESLQCFMNDFQTVQI